MASSSIRWFRRFGRRRYRGVLIACLATLGVSLSLLGLSLYSQNREARAVRGDTGAVLVRTAEEFVQTLGTRRKTLRLLRDALDAAPGLDIFERRALGKSAVLHIPDLMGLGIVSPQGGLSWWVLPADRDEEIALIEKVTARRIGIPGMWDSSSDYFVFPESDRTGPVLVMAEPLNAPVHARMGLIGAFDLRRMMRDFFGVDVPRTYPVRILVGGTVLYQSPLWSSRRTGSTEREKGMVESTIRAQGNLWTFQMQPGDTQTARVISHINTLVLALSLLAALAVITLIWILSMRTWILQGMVRRRTAALRQTTRRLRHLASTDPLTQLHNRRSFLERWEFEVERARRYQRPLACLMVDVDSLKQINDSLGHLVGDEVLRRVADELLAQLRHTDIVGRYGGDEFIVALPETTPAEAEEVAAKLRGAAIEGDWDAETGPVRLSVGTGLLRREESADEVIHAADADLYASRERRIPPTRTGAR